MNPLVTLRPFMLFISFTLVLPCLSLAAETDALNKAIEAHRAGDFALALERLQPLAKQGNAQSQHLLSGMYAEGKGVDKDHEKAFHWEALAAEQNMPSAQYNVGTFYMYGKGIEQDAKAAKDWWLKAANQGHVNAQHNLGTLYYYGLGVTKDPKQALMWFRKAAQQGDTESQRMLQSYEKESQLAIPVVTAASASDPTIPTTVNEPSSTEASNEPSPPAPPQNAGLSAAALAEKITAWTEAGNNHDSTAQLCLGAAYLYGKGVEQNAKQAGFWWKKSAKKGNPDAQFNLAMLQHLGLGVSKNAKAAMKWFKKSAKQKNARAQAIVAAAKNKQSPPASYAFYTFNELLGYAPPTPKSEKLAIVEEPAPVEKVVPTVEEIQPTPIAALPLPPVVPQADPLPAPIKKEVEAVAAIPLETPAITLPIKEAPSPPPVVVANLPPADPKPPRRTVKLSPKQPIAPLPKAATTIDQPKQAKVWIEAQKPSNLTVQLLADRDLNTVQRIVRRYDFQNPLVVFKSQYKDKDWYPLIYGSFSNDQELEQAIAELPKTLRSSMWVRKFREVKRSIAP